MDISSEVSWIRGAGVDELEWMSWSKRAGVDEPWTSVYFLDVYLWLICEQLGLLL